MIRAAKLDDIPYIVSLANKESFSLGFIPKPAYEAAITGHKGGKRWSTTCNDKIFVRLCIAWWVLGFLRFLPDDLSDKIVNKFLAYIGLG